jgi:hypothetical protein
MIAHDGGWFRIDGWFNLLMKFSGFDYGVAKAFAESLGGQHVQMGNIRFNVTEEFISRATKLPTRGERWFKNQSIIVVDLNLFLNIGHQNLEWMKGIPRTWFLDDWNDVLRSV